MHSRKDNLTPDELILVIHGVGDPAPGETISEFARSLAAHGRPMLDQQEVLWLPDKVVDANRVCTFATHVRHVQLTDRNGMMAEVYWGDLSRVRKGIVGAVLGLIEILFGLRYVAYVAAYQGGIWTRLLRRIGLACFNILHGPVLAITFFLALMTISLAGTELMWPNSSRAAFWTRIVMMAICGFSISCAQIGERITENAGVKQFWYWVTITTAFVLGLMLFKSLYLEHIDPTLIESDSIRPGLIWYCQILVSMLALFWILEMLMIIVLAGCWALSMISAGTHRTALHAAFLLPAVSIGFWGLVLPMTWLIAAQSLRRFVKLEKFNELFEQATPLLGIQFMMALALALGGVLVLGRYFLWRFQNLARAVDSEPPRLIIHDGLQLTLAACTMIGVCMVATIGILQVAGMRYEEIWGGNELAEANKYAAGAIIPASFILFMLFPHLRPAIDIVLDVVNHFFFRATQVSDAIDEDEFDITETTLESGSLYFSRRDAVHLRIKKALAYFRDELESRPMLTIISHSQGTMIAIEALNDPELAWLNTAFRGVRLVTMGSPFSHLYQHYFRHLYPSLHDPFWNHLHTRLDRWVNIYRRDDFVGTGINFGSLELSEKGQYLNRAVGMRGHLHYWNDREVLDVIQQELGVRIQVAEAQIRRAA